MIPTLGGVLIGLLCLALYLRFSWYPGYKALRGNPLPHLGDLLPFVLSWCNGCLTVMTVGGLVGFFGDFALWGLNVFGDAYLVFGVGAASGTAPGTASQPLSEGGLFMTSILVVILFPRVRDQWLGWVSGVGMGLSAGIAKFAAIPLASAMNISGAWLTGAING